MQGADRRHHCERVQHTCKFTMDGSIYMCSSKDSHAQYLRSCDCVITIV